MGPCFRHIIGKMLREDAFGRPSGPLNLNRAQGFRRAATERVNMAKKITGYIKLQVPAGAANPSPPIGPALGQRGVNIMEFCKAFNAPTQATRKGHADPDRDHRLCGPRFSFETKTPPATFLLKKAANLKSGSKEPGKVSAGNDQALAARRDRRDQDEGPERQRHRGGDEDHRRLRPRDGPRSGGGLTTWQS